MSFGNGPGEMQFTLIPYLPNSRAVKIYGENLEFAHESLKKDKEVVAEAIKNSKWALDYADESLADDIDLKKIIEDNNKN